MKLVRDKIPDMIMQKGETPITHVADSDTFRKSLIQKIIEEANELVPKTSKEEIADVPEAVYALIKFEGLSQDEIEKIRRAKAEERGSFDKRIILEGVERNG